MPIYEYRCEDCGTGFEKLVRRMTESADLNCPSCGNSRLALQLSTFAAHANGSAQRSTETTPGGCPAGMCRTPDVCGRN